MSPVVSSSPGSPGIGWGAQEHISILPLTTCPSTHSFPFPLFQLQLQGQGAGLRGLGLALSTFGEGREGAGGFAVSPPPQAGTAFTLQH